MLHSGMAMLAMFAAGHADSAADAQPAATPPTNAPAPTSCSGASIRAVDGTVRCIEFESRLMIRVSGSPDRWRADSPRDWIRWPQAINDPAQWITESDAAVQHWLAMPSPRGNRMINFAIDVGADGAVSGCAVERHHGFGDAVPQPYLALCDTFRRSLQIRRAIGRDGQPVASRYAITIRFDEARVPSEAAREPLIAEPRLSPAPPPPPPAIPEWPPTRASRLPTATTIPLAPGGAAALGRETPGWAGVWLTSGPDGPIECAVTRPSGDTRFDRRACDAAMRRDALTFDWPSSGSVYPVRTPIHFVPVNGRPHAIMPVTERITAPTISHAVLERVRGLAMAASAGAATTGTADMAALRVSLTIDAAGTVNQCEVTRTSGNDAADAATCIAFRDSEGIMPGRDIFGWATATRIYELGAHSASP